MPVLSPHRSSAYRSSLGSSALDKPFYGSTSSYNPRYSFSERFTTRSYTDCDGRRTFTRSGSITEDGVTTRFHEETREKSLRRDSVSRDSGIGSIRENSILDTTRRDRENSATRSDGGRYSTVNIAESIADLRNRYSPANYVPAVHRNRESHGRSKSVNGLPPTDRAEPKAGVEKKKVNDGVICNNTAGLPEFANNTNQRADDDDNAHAAEDDNGNRQPVSEIRKRFEPKTPERPDNARRCDEKRPPSKLSKSNDRLDRLENDGSGHRRTDEERNDVGVKFDGPESKFDAKNDAVLNNLDKSTKLTVPRGKERSDDGLAVGGKSRDSQDSVAQDDESSDFKLNGGENSRSANRVNNFSSYISTRDYEKGDDLNGARENDEDANENRNDTMDNSNRIGKSRLYTDKTDTTSPRLNRTVSQNASSSSSNATSSNSVGRNVNDDDRPYDRRISSSPNRHQGLNGLKNIGNTCFMNSVIQCLSNTKPLLEYVRKDMYISDINTSFSSMKGALIKAFSQVVKEVWSEDSSDRVVNTVSLKSQIQRFAPRFMGYSQQDAQEFLRYLLEGLHEDVNRVTNKPAPIHTEIDEKLSDSEKSAESWQRYLRMDNSKIVDIFVGQLKSTLRCTYCGHCSVTFDPFWDLSLPIPQKAGPVRLQQCLESFTREETLDGDEKPTCSKCKERRKCTKSFSIQKFPKILVIHLKRFSPTERFRGKLSVNIDFPLEGLDMSNYAADNRTQCRYNLYAISNHSGTTYSGHYTAYCRHPYSLSWHEYNDSRVSSISPKSIISGEAYVLFYEHDSQKAHL